MSNRSGRLGAVIALLGLLMLALAMPATATQPDPEHKVDICHRTRSDTTPYVFISVDEASLSPGHLDNADPGHKPRTWKSDGVWRGVPHVAGDAKDDYLAPNGETDCQQTVPPPTPTLFTLPSVAVECGGSITVTNFDSGNLDSVLITPGDLVIDGDGTFELKPGDYTAVGLVGEEIVTDPLEFSILECPVITPTPTPSQSSAPTPTPPPLTPLCVSNCAPNTAMPVSGIVGVVGLAVLLLGGLLLLNSYSVSRRR